MQLMRLLSFFKDADYLEVSRNRIKILGWCMLVGNPLFYMLWTTQYVQPHESLFVRAGLTLLGLMMVLAAHFSDIGSIHAQRLLQFSLWLQMPFATSYMLICNQFNLVWETTFIAMIFVYHAFIRWWFAFIGLLCGFTLSFWSAVMYAGLPYVPSLSTMQVPLIALGFAWFCAAMVDISSTNLKQKQIETAYNTIGIVAHEMRTPLAAVHLLGVALANEAVRTNDEASKIKLTKLSAQLVKIATNLNAHIDTQISNARYDRLLPSFERLKMSEVVHSALVSYPFRSDQDRAAVLFNVHTDFVFLGSESQTRQLVHNLIKNAFTALLRGNVPIVPGVLQLDIDTSTSADKAPWLLYLRLRLRPHGSKQMGQLRVTDQALGISPDILPRLFQPFVSTERKMGHGLGLAFCQQVAHAMGATLTVQTQLKKGSTFSLTVPVHHTPHTTHIRSSIDDH